MCSLRNNFMSVTYCICSNFYKHFLIDHHFENKEGESNTVKNASISREISPEREIAMIGKIRGAAM